MYCLLSWVGVNFNCWLNWIGCGVICCLVFSGIWLMSLFGIV